MPKVLLPSRSILSTASMPRGTLLRYATVLIVLGIVGAAWAATALFGNRGGYPDDQLQLPIDPALAKRGAYVAALADCVGCHSKPGGQAFTGGRAIVSPIGKIFTPNITPDKATGIGNYRYGDFERAVRRGISPDGTTLYPVMPYPSYARLTDDDTQALYAYFMLDVKPVSVANRRAVIPWPLSMRWPVTYWRWFFAPSVQPATDFKDPQLARGAYLVEGPGHCGSCHTPKGFAMQEEARSDKDGPIYLSGGISGNRAAGNLRGDALTGLGAWTEDDIVNFLRTGDPVHPNAFVEMRAVVRHSTQFLTPADLKAIAHYLKSQQPPMTHQNFTYEVAMANELVGYNGSVRGALDYMNNCSACHLFSGKGSDKSIPSLAGSSLVLAKNPAPLLTLILEGSPRPQTLGSPIVVAMPGFVDQLNDDDIAGLTTFIRSSWGNKAGAVTADQVARIRIKSAARRLAPDTSTRSLWGNQALFGQRIGHHAKHACETARDCGESNRALERI